MEKKINLNGQDLYFSASDTTFSRRFASAETALLTELAKETPEGGEVWDTLDNYASAFETFFDTVFGAGTSETLWAGIRDLELYVEALKAMQELYTEQCNATVEIMRNMVPAVLN